MTTNNNLSETTNKFYKLNLIDHESMKSTKLCMQNVPEKIIFCIDTCIDSEASEFRFIDGSKCTVLQMVRHVIDVFVQNKHAIGPHHEFALITMNENSVSWQHEFTSNPRDIIKAMSNVIITEINTKETTTFDLTCLLSSIWDMITIPNIGSPSSVIRLILLYNRTNCDTIEMDNFKDILINPCFIVDVIMTHDDEQDGNKVNVMFEELKRIDGKNYSYCFQIGRKPLDFSNSMAKLLAHPFMRLPDEN